MKKIITAILITTVIGLIVYTQPARSRVNFAKKQVLENVISPSSAKFIKIYRNEIANNQELLDGNNVNEKWMVTGEVDLMNGFGVMVRKGFIVGFEIVDGEKKTILCLIENKSEDTTGYMYK